MEISPPPGPSSPCGPNGTIAASWWPKPPHVPSRKPIELSNRTKKWGDGLNIITSLMIIIWFLYGYHLLPHCYNNVIKIFWRYMKVTCSIDFGWLYWFYAPILLDNQYINMVGSIPLWQHEPRYGTYTIIYIYTHNLGEFDHGLMSYVTWMMGMDWGIHP